MTYVTDPELIKRLNSKSSGNYKSVNDSIYKENRRNYIEPERNPIKSYLSKISNIKNQGNNSVLDLIGMDDSNPLFYQDLKNIGGNAIMLALPEAKIASLLGKAAPKFSGGLKLITDYLADIGKVGGSAYLGSRVMGDSNEDAEKSGAIGAGTTAALSPIMSALFSQNPYTRLATGTGIGTLLGYGIGESTGGTPYTTATGAVAGGVSALGRRGIPQLAYSKVFESLTPEQIQRAISRQNSSKNIGVDLNLAESSGNSVLMNLLQDAISTSKGSRKISPFILKREKQEEKSYKDLLENISPENSQKDIIDPLYEKADRDLIPKSDLSKLIKEPTIRRAFNEVQKNPYYSRDLSGVDENSIKYLHQVREYLDKDVVSPTLKKGKRHLASLQKKDVDMITDIMDKASPSYKEARNARSKKFIRKEIESVMANNKLTGRNFYDNVLSNQDEYNKLYYRLRDSSNPDVKTEAQKSLYYMKKSFPDLMDNLSSKSSRGMSEKGKEINVRFGTLAKSFLNKVYLDRYNEAITELMVNPKWHDELLKISKMKSGEDRGISLGRLIGKVSASGEAAINNTQGSDLYGSRS